MSANGEPGFIAMSITCPGCGQTVTNDATLNARHPLDFLQALRDRGWYIPSTQPTSPLPTSGIKPHGCPKCASSSSTHKVTA
jgi:hypothetical protein